VANGNKKGKRELRGAFIVRGAMFNILNLHILLILLDLELLANARKFKMLMEDKLSR
jgi:hypothetical protein